MYSQERIVNGEEVQSLVPIQRRLFLRDGMASLTWHMALDFVIFVSYIEV